MFGGSNTYSIGIWMSRVNEMNLQASNDFGAIYAMILGPTKRVRDWDPFNHGNKSPPRVPPAYPRQYCAPLDLAVFKNPSWFMNMSSKRPLRPCNLNNKRPMSRQLTFLDHQCLPAPPKRCQYDPKGWLMGTPYHSFSTP